MIRIGFATLAAALTASCAGIESDDAFAAAQAEDPQVSRAPSADLMYELMAGEIAGHYEDLEESVTHYLNALRMTDDPGVAARATSIALYADDEVSAREAALRWVHLTPSDPEARQTLAVLYVRAGQPRAAMPHLEYLIDHAPGAAGNGFMLIGATLAQEHDSDAALAAMRMLVERHDDEPLAQFAYANLALSAAENDEAAAAAARALALDPALTEARAVRARALLGSGETAQAASEMRKAVGATPDDDELRLAFAKMLMQMERFGEASAQFRQLLNERPQDPELLYTLGLLDLQERNYAHAGEYFQRLNDGGRRVHEARYYLGRVAQERKQFDEALRWYGQVRRGQFRIDAQARTATIFGQRGELEEGRDYLRKARLAEREPVNVVQLYLAEGQLLREAGRYQAGIKLFGEALAEHPGNSDLLYARALMAEQIGRIDRLEADLRTILHADPDNATALNALGFTLVDHNERVPEALGYIKRAFAARPNDAAVIDSMGWAHFRLGNYARAEHYLRRAFKLLPDSEIAGHLSEVMWTRGQKDEARSVLREALTRESEHEYLLELRDRYAR